MKSTRLLVSAAGASVAAIGLALAAPLAASAHVHVDPDRASVGSYATLTFKVPTESATAGTVKLEVDLPTATPFGSVSYQPVPGWTASVTTEKLAKPVKTGKSVITEAPVKITWTADPGVRIEPGQFQEFTISAGAMPDIGSVELPAHQYYSDGTVVDWDQKTPASGHEPERPAPTVYISEAPPAADDDAVPSVVAVPAASSAGAGSVGGNVVAIGLALGAIALVVAVFAAARRSMGPRS